jgi:hypothetical protein
MILKKIWQHTVVLGARCLRVRKLPQFRKWEIISEAPRYFRITLVILHEKEYNALLSYYPSAADKIGLYIKQGDPDLGFYFSVFLYMYMSVYDGWHQVAHPHPRKILT